MGMELLWLIVIALIVFFFLGFLFGWWSHKEVSDGMILVREIANNYLL
jgi:hypothetical protein